MRRSGVQPNLSSPSYRTLAVILRERFAHGEIDREEFLQRLEDLNGH